MFTQNEMPKMIISPSHRHCSLDLSRIISELDGEGKTAFCCAYQNYPEIMQELTDFFEDNPNFRLQSIALKTEKTPVYILYDAARHDILIQEARIMAEPIIERCQGCWTMDPKTRI